LDILTKFVHSVPRQTLFQGDIMAKDVIQMHGQDVVVREDTAKAFRGINWAIVSVAGFILITAVLFLVFFLGSAKDGSVEGPGQIQDSRGSGN